MFEENNNINDLDSGFKAILDQAQEPAPAHVWDRIEADLDKIARRRVAVLWFRRAAVGAAAAAALTFGVFFGHNGEEDIVNPVAGGSAIAVVEQQETQVQTEEAVISGTESAPSLLAMAHKVDPKKEFASEEIPATEASEVHEASENIDSKPVTKNENRPAAPSKSRTENNAQTERFPDVWPEDEPQKNRIRTSLVLSGITGTNSAQNSTRRNPMKRPAISAAPKKTGIKETSTNTIYGIPVSAGIGVRIGFTPKWSLGAGINYTLLTRKFYGTYTMVGNDGGILKDISSDIRNSQHYIGIPVNAYYNIVNQDKINFYTYAGGTVEKCISDKYHVVNTEITHSEKAKGVQLSANVGLGVEFMLGKHLGLYIDPSLRYYFECGQPKSIRTAQPLMLGFEMGFRARL